MAELLNKIPSNLTEYPNSFKRQGAFPLEAYSVFYTMDAAEAYASSNPISYVGQTLAVVTANVENPAVVDDVTFYIIADAAGTLQEVGKATNGDDNTITLTDGVLSLKGFDAAPNATLPQKTPVYVKDDEGNDTDVVDHYELRWVAIDAIVEGDTNTKTVVAAGDEETHVIIETVRDEANDTNTYKISLDLSAYATNTAVGNAIDAAKNAISESIAGVKEELEGAISDVEDKFDGIIGTEASEGVEASGLYAAIAAAEQRAKNYADANDTDTIYDDSEVKSDISDHETRIGAIETAIGDSSKGLIKALADEVSAREQGDTDTLNTAKDYTDDEITGLNIVIEKKTVEDVESDYIVIKNKSGEEVASVNAAKFVKDGMLESAVYSTDTKKLTLTWNTDAGKSATEIDLNDLVNTYTGSEGIVVDTEGKISVNPDYVALQSDLTSLETALDNKIATKRTETEVDAQIDAKLVDVNAAIATKADAETVNAAIDLKADKTALEEAVETLGNEIATKADATATQNAIAAKLDKTEFDNAKGDFALKTDVNSSFTSVGQRIGVAEADIDANTQAIEDLEAAVAETYATKEALKATDDKAVSNEGAISNLTSRLDGIVAQGGEPNVINNIKVNGVVQTIAADKSVDISVPVISEVKVENLNDGQALINRVAEVETDVKALDTAVSGNQSGISALAGRVAALEAEVVMEAESRIDALEAVVNGVTGGPEGIVAKVATHTSEIAGLKAQDTELATLIQGNTNKFADYYTKTAIDGIVTGLEESIGNVDLSSRVAVSDFEAYKTAQKTLTDTLATKAELEATNTEVAKKADKTDLANYYTKDEANAEFMTEAEVKATVDAVVAAAVDTDTLEGLAQLVTYVHDNAGDIAELVSDVEANAAAIETNKSGIAANKAAHEKNASDIAALITSVAAQKVIESTEISTSTVEGGMQLGIKEVNVNKLVQTEGEVLILNGGSASI